MPDAGGRVGRWRVGRRLAGGWEVGGPAGGSGAGGWVDPGQVVDSWAPPSSLARYGGAGADFASRWVGNRTEPHADSGPNPGQRPGRDPLVGDWDVEREAEGKHPSRVFGTVEWDVLQVFVRLRPPEGRAGAVPPPGRSTYLHPWTTQLPVSFRRPPATLGHQLPPPPARTEAPKPLSTTRLPPPPARTEAPKPLVRPAPPPPAHTH